jgi:hypothetical protein
LQDLLSQPFELLPGRRTYEIFAAYWPHVRASSASHAIADLFNTVPKHVATHRSDTMAVASTMLTVPIVSPKLARMEHIVTEPT